MICAQIYQLLPSSSELLSEAVVSVLELFLSSILGVHFIPQFCQAEPRSRDHSTKALNILAQLAYPGWLAC